MDKAREAMPFPMWVRYKVYRRGFEAGISTMPDAPVRPPYRRRDYRTLWQRGFDVGANLLVEALKMQALREMNRPVVIDVVADPDQAPHWQQMRAANEESQI